MSSDFKRKEPSKTEKVLYELFVQQQGMHQNLTTNSAHIVAMSIILGVEPEKVAELLINGSDKIKDYSEKINRAIDKLEEARKASSKTETADEHAGHNHV